MQCSSHSKFGSNILIKPIIEKLKEKKIKIQKKIKHLADLRLLICGIQCYVINQGLPTTKSPIYKLSIATWLVDSSSVVAVVFIPFFFPFPRREKPVNSFQKQF